MAGELLLVLVVEGETCQAAGRQEAQGEVAETYPVRQPTEHHVLEEVVERFQDHHRHLLEEEEGPYQTPYNFQISISEVSVSEGNLQCPK